LWSFGAVERVIAGPSGGPGMFWDGLEVLVAV
jgi:hypothetical protein